MADFFTEVSDLFPVLSEYNYFFDLSYSQYTFQLCFGLTARSEKCHYF